MRAAIDRDAETYTLTDVRRFTDRLGTRRQPAAARRRRRRGRSTTTPTAGSSTPAPNDEAVAAVARAAAADRLAGHDVVVVTATNEHAAAVNAAIRGHLADAGLVGEAAVLLGRDGTACRGRGPRAGPPDRPRPRPGQPRRSTPSPPPETTVAWTSSAPAPARPSCPARVRRRRRSPSATPPPPTPRRAAPSTPATSCSPPGLDRAGAYVGLTRGRQANTAWAVTDTVDPTNPDQPAATGRGLLARALHRHHHVGAIPDPGHPDAAAVDVAAADEACRAHADTLLALIEDETRLACPAPPRRRPRHPHRRRRPVRRTCGPRLGADQGTDHLARLLRGPRTGRARPPRCPARRGCRPVPGRRPQRRPGPRPPHRPHRATPTTLLRWRFTPDAGPGRPRRLPPRTHRPPRRPAPRPRRPGPHQHTRLGHQSSQALSIP